MAFVAEDRVKESTSTTGTGALSLEGSAGEFQSFGDVMADADTCTYTIVDESAGEFEVGEGTYDAGNDDLKRTTVRTSSNAGAKVDFPAGGKTVFMAAVADRTPQLDSDPSSGDIPKHDGNNFQPTGRLAKGDTPTETAYEDEANTFTPQQQFDSGLDTRGDVVDDSDMLYRTSDKVFEQPAAGQNNTVVVTGDPSTRLARATAVDNAIGEAGTNGKDFVFVPAEFGPGADGYDASAVNFTKNGFSGVLIDESRRITVDAYGAAGNGTIDDGVSFRRFVSAVKGTGYKATIPGKNYLIGNDILVDDTIHIDIQAGAVLDLAATPTIDYGEKNNQNSSTGFAMFKIVPGAEKSVIDGGGIIDMNGENTGTDSDGNTNAPIAVWVYQCNNVHVSGRLSAKRTNHTLHIVDADDVSFETVYAENAVSRFPSGSAVTLEGVRRASGEKIIARDGAEALDLNNENKGVTIDVVKGLDCDETVDINGSHDTHIRNITTDNPRKAITVSGNTNARFSQRTIDSSYYGTQIDRLSVFLDGNSSQDYSSTTELIAQYGASTQIDWRHIEVRILSSFGNLSTKPDRIGTFTLDRGAELNIFVYASGVKLSGGVKIKTFSESVANIKQLLPLSDGGNAVEVEGGKNSQIQHLLLETDTGSSRTAVQNNGNSVFVDDWSISSKFDNEFVGRFGFGNTVPQREGERISTEYNKGQQEWNTEFSRPKFYNGTEFVLASGHLDTRGDNLTISSGAITVDGRYHVIWGESGNDTLTTINEKTYTDFQSGDIIALGTGGNDDITITNTDNITIPSGTDTTITESNVPAVFMKAPDGNWVLINESDVV